MKRDPMELVISAVGKSLYGGRRTRRSAVPARPVQRLGAVSIAPDAIDEAFATLPRTANPESRVDPASNRDARHGHLRSQQVVAANSLTAPSTPAESPSGDGKPMARRADYADLAAQVAALDRQCDELARLFHGLEIASMAE